MNLEDEGWSLFDSSPSFVSQNESSKIEVKENAFTLNILETESSFCSQIQKLQEETISKIQDQIQYSKEKEISLFILFLFFINSSN